MKHRDYSNRNTNDRNTNDIFIQDMDREELHSYPSGKTFPGEGMPPKRRKRRRRRGIALPVFLCIIALGSLTGCLFLVIKNRLLETEISEAAAYVEEMNNTVLYTEEETADMINAAVSDASRQKEEDILGRVKTMMENGEGTSAMLRELYPGEIVVAADSRYYFFPVLDLSLIHI